MVREFDGNGFSDIQSIEFHCSECGSPNIGIIYKNNYNIKCRDCGKTMPIIKVGCLTCGHQLEIHEDQNQFYFQCNTCKTTKMFAAN